MIKAALDHYSIILPKLANPAGYYGFRVKTGYVSREEDQEQKRLGLRMMERPFPGADYIVMASSPQSHRRAAEALAIHFRREFGYDFVQYSAKAEKDTPKGSVDRRTRCFLWMSRRLCSRAVIGAACFRWHEWKDAPDSFALDWVWFHPYERRKGYLSSSWPYFRWRFGEFWVETPLSEAMIGFLKKHGFPNKDQEARYRSEPESLQVAYAAH
jgi:hypothetical protein